METVTEPPEIRQNEDFQRRSWIVLDVTRCDIMRLSNGLLVSPFSDFSPSSLRSPSQQVQQRRENTFQRAPFSHSDLGLSQSPRLVHFNKSHWDIIRHICTDDGDLEENGWMIYIKDHPASQSHLSRMCLTAVISTSVIDSWFSERGYWCNWQQDGALLWTIIRNVSYFGVHLRVNGLP